MRFHKYHALGNDYIVLDPKSFSPELTEQGIRLICHRNFGVGSDGILWGPLPSQSSEFGLRIFNPDGSEAEKSGNAKEKEKKLKELLLKSFPVIKIKQLRPVIFFLQKMTLQYLESLRII